MAFVIEFTQRAADHVRAYRKYDQQIILDSIAEQLTYEPAVETRSRKRLGENQLSDWELHVQDFRVFYDIILDDERQAVVIKAVGHKDHNRLFIGTEEVRL